MTEQLDGIGSFAPRNTRDSEMWERLKSFVRGEPKAFQRDPSTDHVTGSAFVLSPDRQKVLLTHHKKLDRWLQLGGHCDGIADAEFVARREAYEESGLEQLTLIQPNVFDIDIHRIPASVTEQEHLHYDVRYLFQASDEEFNVSNESHALAWVPLTELTGYTQAQSVLVLTEKLGVGAE